MIPGPVSVNRGAAVSPPLLDRRCAGVLLHPTSLPAGTLGVDAERFMDFLRAGGFSVWQMLPLGPVGPNGSPYSSDSAFAGNAALIPPGCQTGPIDRSELERFQAQAAYWLEDYALFQAIRHERGGQAWWDWPEELRQRKPGALQTFANQHAGAITRCVEEQFRFEQAWQRVREAAARRGILLYGDLPMFVVADSADVWTHPDLFRLDRRGRPTHVAGVPPDAFAALGQCWDNPVFDWAQMRAQGFDWWRQRLVHECRRFDLLRWDHFRGLAAIWEIPVTGDGGHKQPAAGAWHAVPGRELLDCLARSLGSLPLVAENLGIITPEVEELRKSFGLPGMHVLQFAFDGNPANPHLPVNHEVQGVAYTGTHDNDTSLGWWCALSGEARQQVLAALGNPAMPMPDALIHAALDSRCRLAVIPLQDLLGLDTTARMNIPGQAQGQWRWKFSWDQIAPAQVRHWRGDVGVANRL